MENKCLQDTWRQGCDCLVSRAHFWLRTERPWSAETTGLIMWVHRKVSQHCCANHVSGHRLKAGQMLGIGQWGYVILIRGGFGEVGGGGLWILFSTSASPCRKTLPLVLCPAPSPSFFSHSLQYSQELVPSAAPIVSFLFSGSTFFFPLITTYRHSSEFLENTFTFLLVTNWCFCDMFAYESA